MRSVQSVTFKPSHVEEVIDEQASAESGRRSMAQLSTPQTVDAVDSTYKKLKRPMQKGRTPVGDVCTYCGVIFFVRTFLEAPALHRSSDQHCSMVHLRDMAMPSS